MIDADVEVPRPDDISERAVVEGAREILGLTTDEWNQLTDEERFYALGRAASRITQLRVDLTK